MTITSNMLFFVCTFWLASLGVLETQSAPSLTVSDIKDSSVSGANLRAVGSYLQKSTGSTSLDDNIELLQEALDDGGEQEVARFVAGGRTPGFVEIAKMLVALGETSDEQVICTPENMEFFRSVADDPSPGLRTTIIVQKLLLKAKDCPKHFAQGWTHALRAGLLTQFESHNYYNDMLNTKLFRELQSTQTAQRGLENNVVFLSSIANKMASAEYYRGNNFTAFENLKQYEEAWDRDFIEPCRHIVSDARLGRLALPIANLEIAAAKFNAWEADEFESEHYLDNWANRYMTCNVLLGLQQKRLLSVLFTREHVV